MSYVFEILFAVLTLALPELGWTRASAWPWAVGLAGLLPYAAAFGARRALLHGRFRIGAVLERALVVLPVLLQALALVEFGWLTTLERHGLGRATLEDWVGLELLWALAPYFLYQALTIDARARALVFPPDTPGKARVFQMRLFVAALVPFVAYLAGASLLERSSEWKARFEEVGLLSGAAAVLLLALFLYGMPLFLRYAWDTVPLAKGWARTALEQAARKAGFSYRELLLWRTGEQMANAAIVGFSPRSRRVFFSDLLLAQLGPRELAAVFAHEMGHARRAHSMVFGAFALGFFLAAQSLAGVFDWESELAVAAWLLGLLSLWYLAFGFLSRRFELEADLESLRVVGESDSLVRALELVTGAHAHQRASWRHFSTQDRVAFLRAAEANPVVGIRLRQKLARWRKLGFTLFAVSVGFKGVELARSWNQDWLVVDLRQGRFEEALARSDDRWVSTELAALAHRAAGFAGAEREPRALGFEAFSAWKRGDIPAALEWLELARLRGAGSLDGLVESILEAPAAAGRLPGVWKEALERLEAEHRKES